MVNYSEVNIDDNKNSKEHVSPSHSIDKTPDTSKKSKKRRSRMTKLPETYQNDTPVSTIWSYFLDTTTMHALPHVFDKRLNCFRILWFIIFVGATSVLCFHGSILIRRFLDRPFQVSIQMEHRDQMHFPAVTVCNLNPVRASVLNHSEVWRNVVRMQERFECERIANVSDNEIEWMDQKTRVMIRADIERCKHKMNDSKFEVDIRGVHELDKEFHDAEDDADGYIIKEDDSLAGHHSDDLAGNFAKIAMASETSDLSDVTWLLKFSLQDIANFRVIEDDLVKECSFDRATCPAASRSTFVSLKYGKCETFNSALTSDSIISTRRSGGKSGVRMTINVRTDEYVGMLARTYGARVVIHWPYDKPHPYTAGFNVPPGVKTSVSVRRQRLKRLSSPYASNCSDNFPYPDNTWVNPGFRRPQYSYIDCRYACISSHMLYTCGCIEQSSAYLVNGNTTLHEILAAQDAAKGGDSRLSKRICDMTISADRACKVRIYERMRTQVEADKIKCDACNAPCTENIYKRTISMSDWPSDQFALAKIHGFFGRDEITKYLQRDYEVYRRKDHNPVESSVPVRDEDDTFAENNLPILQVYLESLNAESVVEDASYPFTNLLADIGGILGLYLGLSLTTLIEVFQFFFFLVTHKCFGRI